MWELISILAKNVKEVESCLLEDYEPFAITDDGYPNGERLWLKRMVKDAPKVRKQQPRTSKETGRRTAGKSKTKDSS